jgi:hypothetical protein
LSFHICRDLREKQGSHASECPANEIINKIEEAAKPLGFDMHKKKVSNM